MFACALSGKSKSKFEGVAIRRASARALSTIDKAIMGCPNGHPMIFFNVRITTPKPPLVRCQVSCIVRVTVGRRVHFPLKFWKTILYYKENCNPSKKTVRAQKN